jgi:HEPN domain-containing protein
MPRRHKDWLAQAERDLKAAKDSLKAGNYEWCSFQAQQAAEKALKALLLYFNREAREHSVVHLLREARTFVKTPQDLMAAAQELDRHYIQSRYPNDLPEGYPGEYYDERLAKECIAHAQSFLDLARSIIA